MEHSLFCLLKNPNDQAEQRAYELWNRHSRAQSPAHKKAANTEGVIFLLVRQKQGQRFLTRNSWRNFLGWRKEHNTTPSFRKRSPTKKEQKQLLATKETQRDGGYGDDIGDKFCRVFRQNKVCVCVFFLAEFCSSSANSTNFAILREKFRQSFRCYKIEKKNTPGNLGYLLRFHQYVTLNVYSNSRYQLYPWYLIPSPFFLLRNKHQHKTPAHEYSTHH